MHCYTFTNARHWPAEVALDSVFVPAGATVTLPFTLMAPDTAARGAVDLTFTAWPTPVLSATASFTTPAFVSPLGVGVGSLGAHGWRSAPLGPARRERS